MAKILIIDDELSFREALFYALGQRGHQATTAIHADHASDLMATEPFDLLSLDAIMPGQTGIEFLKKIRASGNSVPAILYSAHVEASLEKEARRSGAQEVLHKSCTLAVLTDRVEKVLAAHGRPTLSAGSAKKKLLVVDDESSVRGVLSIFFTKRGYEVTEASSGEDAIARLERIQPDVVLLDMHMTGMDGLDTLKAILQRSPRMGVVMATGEENDRRVHEAMQVGAYGYVLKPFDFLYLELVVASRLALAENPPS